MENAETKSFFPWKKKAILRGEELRKLRKRFKEMEESRDNWKEKSMNHKEIQVEQAKKIKALETELAGCKKKLQLIQVKNPSIINMALTRFYL